MIAFKGFTPDLTSRLGNGVKKDCTFEPGCTMESKESKTARTGYHCCENPFECLAYYSFDGKNRFFKVVADGDIDEDDQERISCTKITLEQELSFVQFAMEGMKYMIEHPQRPWEQFKHNCTVQADEAEAVAEYGIAIARGEHPRVKGVAGSITGLILEKDGVIQNAKLIMLHKGENDLANKWITIDENREVKVLAE